MQKPRMLSIAFLAVCQLALAAAPWHHPLYLAGDGYWRKRIPVTIANNGDTAAAGTVVRVLVGREPGQTDLEGARAEALRCCSAEGVELLFSINDSDGMRVVRGPIPAGASIALPAECAARASTVCYLYFENPAAWQVPDFLGARGELLNGGVENGEGATPSSWQHDAPDATRRAEWVAENPHAGARCLKTVVAAGAQPSWIATRQGGIAITPGAAYVMRAWVKAENVEGYAGWYIHVGDSHNPMRISPMLNGGGGTYDWKEVTAEFTAPADADTAELGTVLWGTGTAWFDDVTLTTSAAPALGARAGAVETCALAQVDATGPMPEQAPDARMTVKVFNFGENALENALVSVGAGRLAGWCGEWWLYHVNDREHDCYRLDEAILFNASLAPRSVTTCAIDCRHVIKAPAHWERARFHGLFDGPHNLVKNWNFESVGYWMIGDVPLGTRVTVTEGGCCGTRCGLVEDTRTTPSWIGRRQNIAVEPGATYFYGAWVKCEYIASGSIAVHVHARTKTGELSKHQAFFGTGATVTRPCKWTFLSGTLTMPEDASVLQLHLTMLAKAKIYHDGAIVARVVPGVAGALAVSPVKSFTAWPVNALIKVFPDTPPGEPNSARGFTAPDESLGLPRPKLFTFRFCLELARNEKEPLQIAVRSPVAVSGVTVSAEITRDERANAPKIDAVNVVGYVPVDYPTNYYRNDGPSWQRRVPRESVGCDGWPGLWSDPLLPTATFDLAADTTRSVWVTFSAQKDCPAGHYSGSVRFAVGERVLATTPFQVVVRDFTLPDERHVGAIYDVRLGGVWDVPGKSAEETKNDLWRFLAERRLSPDRIAPDPRIEWKDGKVVADFEAYDKAAEIYFDTCKFPFSYMPQVFYLFGWGHLPQDKFGEAPYEGAYPYEGVDRKNLRPAFVRAYQACLGAYWRHVKEKGWDKKLVLYISDEPFDTEQKIRDQMLALCAMIRGVDPAIPIYSSTWHHQPAWDGAISVWGLGHYGVVPPESLAKIKSFPSRVWFTTDGQMCLDTPFLAVERLLPHYCFAHGAQAYEFWGCTWLTYDPYEFGWHSYIHQSESPGQSTWVRYPNGDGYLIYPGAPKGIKAPVSSIRLEQAREGVEDYEYLYLLKELARAKNDADAARLGEEAAELVRIPNAGGRYSTKILPEPAKVFELRSKLADAIERLGRK